MSNEEEGSLSKAIKIIKEALEHDKNEEYERALQHYQTALKFFMESLKQENNEKVRENIRKRVLEYLERAEKIKRFINDSDSTKSGQSCVSSGQSCKLNTKKAIKNVDNIDEDEDKHRSILASSIVRETPNVKWEDIAGLHVAKEVLQEAIILPLRFPNLFIGFRTPWNAILLYGPPGTGKSFLAKAVATESGSTFFSISSADLLSKWMGESEKLVKGLFRLAVENQPSVIFIDEIDSICGARGGDNESEASRRIKTEILIQMQSLTNLSDGCKNKVMVLGATNLPWSLDSAVRRRFEKRIYIPLPDYEARLYMLHKYVGSPSSIQNPSKINHSLSPSDFEEIARMTEGYSGSDIYIVVRDFLMIPIRKFHSASHFKKVVIDEKVMFTPCDKDDKDSIHMDWSSVKSDELLEPCLMVKDFKIALGRTKPSISQMDIEKHVKFTAEFGQDG